MLLPSWKISLKCSFAIWCISTCNESFSFTVGGFMSREPVKTHLQTHAGLKTMLDKSEKQGSFQKFLKSSHFENLSF